MFCKPYTSLFANSSSEFAKSEVFNFKFLFMVILPRDVSCQFLIMSFIYDVNDKARRPVCIEHEINFD